MTAPRNPSASPLGPTSPRLAAPISSARAFVATLAGVGDVAPGDPHRTAKWAGGIASLAITLVFVANAIRGHRAARAEGFRAGKLAAAKRAALPPRSRKR